MHSLRCDKGVPRKMGFEVTAPLSNQRAGPDASMLSKRPGAEQCAGKFPSGGLITPDGTRCWEMAKAGDDRK